VIAEDDDLLSMWQSAEPRVEVFCILERAHPCPITRMDEDIAQWDFERPVAAVSIAYEDQAQPKHFYLLFPWRALPLAQTINCRTKSTKPAGRAGQAFRAVIFVACRTRR